MGNKDMLDYIHFQRDNFLRTRQLLGAEVNTASLSSEIHKKYLEIAAVARARQDELRALTPIADDLLSIFATSQQMDTLLENSNMDNDIYKQVSIDKELRDMSIELVQFNAKTKTLDNQIGQLANLLDNMEDILNHLDVINGELLDYCAHMPEHQQQSVQQSFGANGQLHILNINPTAISSLKSLKGRIEPLKQIATIGSGLFPQTVTYTNSKGEQAQTSVFGLVYSLRQLIINILGGYGEAMAAIYAMEKADEIIQQAFGNNPNIVIEGAGTSKMSNGQTSKSDVKLLYSDGNINLNIGMSAKAQLLKSGKSTTTTFQTSKLEVFMRGIEKQLEYNFLNNLYHNRASINEQMILNRYIAAMNFDNAVTGWDMGDRVLFLSYLDQVISVADFYNSIINKGKTKISNYPSLSIPGIGKKLSDFRGVNPDKTLIDEIPDETPLNKSALAWQRARDVRKAMLGMNTQIQFKH